MRCNLDKNHSCKVHGSCCTNLKIGQSWCKKTNKNMCKFIRKKMKLSPEKAIFLFINGCIPPSSCIMAQFYSIYKDIDGFLYITYAYENTFG